MLYLIGLGLRNEKSLSLHALDVLKSSERIFLEGYTSKQVDFNLDSLKELIGKNIEIVGRDFVENTENIIALAKSKDVALLIAGDPMVATTHIELVLDAYNSNVKVEIINNASVINAVANIGLEIYKFGKITSIPFTTESFMPETPYNIIADNLSIQAHTLCLLDLRLEESRFMSFKEALNYLLSLEKKIKKGIISEDSLVVVCAGLGSEKERIIFGKVKDVLQQDLDVFPQCLIIPSKLHFIEEEALKRFSLKNTDKTSD